MRTSGNVLVGLLLVTVSCATEPGEQRRYAGGNQVQSQLRGYDLGPPFPGGLRNSGLVNGYAEGEWIPFVAVIEGEKLVDADAAEGTIGDGQYRLGIILPTHSARHEANGISELATVGTYGAGAITPIPDPFDDGWLIAHGYDPFVLGAWADGGEVDAAPVILGATQRTGPRRFGGDVSSVSVAIRFQLTAATQNVEVRFAVRLAPPGLAPIIPGGQPFPGVAPGAALGAADFFPGPGPLFVGYEVGDPTGIATVPIRVERNHCVTGEDCVLGDVCSPDGDCVHPCYSDTTCPTGEFCEDGFCEPPPGDCTDDIDCPGEHCVGGYCVPTCPDDCADPELCDLDPCLPPDGPPGCVEDGQCDPAHVCEDGVCQPPTPPCDMSCADEFTCEDGVCVPPTTPCSLDAECPGGEACLDGVCQPLVPPCLGSECPPCTVDADCQGGDLCQGGFCVPLGPPLACLTPLDCPADQACVNGWCDPYPPAPCTTPADCATGELCTGGWCDPPGGCTADYQCPGGELCDDGTCNPGQPPVPCTVESDCPPGPDDVYPPTCLGGFCTPTGDDSCGGDVDCPGGMVCDRGECVGGDAPIPCVTAFDCAGGAVCEGGYCTPTDPGAECTTNADCPATGDDDVPPACVGGMCTDSPTVPDACTTSADCSAGTVCDAGVCVRVDGACEITADCADGQRCMFGWCGVPCDADTECAGGVCADGRCAASCTTAAECAPFEACLGGACTPLFRTVAGNGSAGDEAFAVLLEGEGESTVAGGCSAAGARGGSDPGPSGAVVLALTILGFLGVRRRGAWIALVLFPFVVAIAACGDSDPASTADAGAPDATIATADAPVTPADASADAAPPESPWLLVTCDGDPADPDAGIDQGCCDPTGVCPADQACLEGLDDARRCRPRCPEGACPPGGACADFGGTPVCIPASTEGLPCAPELCDAATICVGSSADDAICRRRCTDTSECEAGQTCTTLQGSTAMACLD